MSVFVTIVFALLLNLGFVFLRHRRRRIQASKRGSREEVYLGLRNLALRSSREQSNLAPTSSTKEPWGVLMNWGVGDGTATAVALSNGHASIYLSCGGGYLGGAQSHDSVRNAAKKMVAAAVEIQPQTLAAKEFPLPPTGKVSFYLLTDEGLFTASATEEELSGGRHPLSKLGNAAQEVITQYRLIQPAK